ncbi:TRAP transporter small permease [Bacillus marinisedimentorum]|uniref:TRAP transporter small permease n=1 Tax=Bacillus marinisedimentorum TaxID=1821260 RepID=UPI000871BC5C|nr:TRAP transporter small permease [Bacillus marinisedimentorum]
MKTIRWLDRYFEEVLLVLFTTVMVSVIFLQVIMRLMDNSLSWSEELARYAFIWLVYIGISYGVKKQRHIKVDVMLVLLKERGRIILTIFANILFLIFAIFVINYGYQIATKLLAFGQQSPALHIPMGLVYMATPIGMGLTVIRLIQNLIILIEGLRNPDRAHIETEAERVKENPNE